MTYNGDNLIVGKCTLETYAYFSYKTLMFEYMTTPAQGTTVHGISRQDLAKLPWFIMDSPDILLLGRDSSRYLVYVHSTLTVMTLDEILTLHKLGYSGINYTLVGNPAYLRLKVGAIHRFSDNVFSNPKFHDAWIVKMIKLQRSSETAKMFSNIFTQYFQSLANALCAFNGNVMAAKVIRQEMYPHWKEQKTAEKGLFYATFPPQYKFVHENSYLCHQPGDDEGLIFVTLHPLALEDYTMRDVRTALAKSASSLAEHKYPLVNEYAPKSTQQSMTEIMTRRYSKTASGTKKKSVDIKIRKGVPRNG